MVRLEASQQLRISLERCTMGSKCAPDQTIPSLPCPLVPYRISDSESLITVPKSPMTDDCRALFTEAAWLVRSLSSFYLKLDRRRRRASGGGASHDGTRWINGFSNSASNALRR
ncbi:hypothetical protein AB1N83_007788 [Pleurotus pulmonarius]